MNVIVPAPSQHLQSRQTTDNRKKSARSAGHTILSPVLFFDLCAFGIFNVDDKSSKMIKIKIGFWVIGKANGSMSVFDKKRCQTGMRTYQPFSLSVIAVTVYSELRRSLVLISQQHLLHMHVAMQTCSDSDDFIRLI